MAGLGGYGTCNNGVCAVLVCCMYLGLFISHASFIFGSGFICVLSLFRVCFPFRPLYSRVVIVYDIKLFHDSHS